jgi:hypothetical protein
MTWNTTSAQTAPKNAPPINEMKRVAFVISHNGEVSDGNQPPMTFHLSLNESVGSRSLDRFVERSRYAACKTGLLRLRTSRAVGLVLHWPLTETSSGCRRLAVHDARQTVNGNL